MVVEIGGKRYTVKPNQPILVDYLGELKSLDCDKVLLIADEKGLKLGKPYLNQKIEFKLLDQVRSKIRVATYKAKANTRRVKGEKMLKSKIVLVN